MAEELVPSSCRCANDSAATHRLIVTPASRKVPGTPCKPRGQKAVLQAHQPAARCALQRNLFCLLLQVGLLCKFSSRESPAALKNVPHGAWPVQQRSRCLRAGEKYEQSLGRIKPRGSVLYRRAHLLGGAGQAARVHIGVVCFMGRTNKDGRERALGGEGWRMAQKGVGTGGVQGLRGRSGGHRAMAHMLRLWRGGALDKGAPPPRSNQAASGAEQ